MDSRVWGTLIQEMFQGREAMSVREIVVEGGDINNGHDDIRWDVVG